MAPLGGFTGAVPTLLTASGLVMLASALPHLD